MMAYRTALASLGALALIGAAAPAAQADVIATLTFDTPTGTVASNVAIPVFVTLHLDPTSDPITTDGSGVVTSPLSPQNIIDLGGHSTGVIVNNSFVCTGTFTNICGPGAYTFNFNFTPPSFVGPANLSLQPGSSTTFLFGTFNPTGGNAAPGTYTFYDARFEFEYFDHMTNMAFFSMIADTCDPFGATCSFTRTVFAAGVPEPTTWAMMILGVAGIGVALRRKGEAATAAA